MCLTRNNERLAPKRTRTVYKLVTVVLDDMYDGPGPNVRTVYQRTLVLAGWLVANGRVAGRKRVGAGAIHAYTTLKLAKSRRRGTVIKCEAFPGDFIAWGIRGDVAYKRILVDKQELRRVIANERRRQRRRLTW